MDCPAHFMNLLRPHASTVGNHEFDWGADKAADYLRRLSFPNLVSAALCPPVQPSMLRSRQLAGPQSSPACCAVESLPAPSPASPPWYSSPPHPH